MPLVRTPRSLAWMLAPLLAAGLTAGCGTHTGRATAQGAAAAHAATTPDTIAQTSWTLTRWTSAAGQPRPVGTAVSSARTSGTASPEKVGGRSGSETKMETEDRQIKLDFLARGKDYRVAGFSGCNAYQGSYDLSKGKLSITAPASTRMACPSSAAAALEHDYLKALASIKTFSLDSSGAPRLMTLTLNSGDVLEFTRGDDPPTRS